MATPLGFKNNNPMNLRHSGDRWIGMRTEQTDPGFVQFQTSFHGLRAAAKNLLTYYRRYERRTVSAIVTAWAPSSDGNDTRAYITTVAKSMGVDPDGIIDLNDKLTLRRLMDAMIRVELGSQPYSTIELEAAIESAHTTDQAPPVVETRPSPRPSPTGKPPLVDQPSKMPTRKIVVGGIVGACAFMLMVIWNRIFPESPLSTEYATEIASAIVLVVTLVTQYMVRNRATDIPPGEDDDTKNEAPVKKDVVIYPAQTKSRTETPS